jgi:type III secretion protein C
MNTTQFNAKTGTQLLMTARHVPNGLISICRSATLALALSLFLFLSDFANAVDIEWKKEISTLKYTDRPITEVILGILTANEVAANVSDSVKGTVSIKVGARDSRKVFESLCRTNGLVWFYDGQVVNVVASSEQITKIISVSPLDVEGVNAALNASGLKNKRLPFKYIEASSTYILTGPNRYVNLVEEVIQSAVKRTDKIKREKFDPSKAVTRVFRLTQAWADDLSVQGEQGVVKVPGIATVLRAQFGRSSVGTSALLGGGMGALSAAAGDGARGGLETKTLDSEGNAVSSSDSAFPMPKFGNFVDSYRYADSMNSGPKISADPRTNSIIITDDLSRMAEYQEIIKTLDVRSPIIEIEVAIIEVDSASALVLGVDWEVNRARQKDVASTSGNAVDKLAYGSGQLMMRLSKNGLDAFMANLSLLSTDGRARIVQRPRVITVDNFEAIIGSSEKAFVRVAGRDAVALYPVSTGLNFRVRPRVLGEIDEAGQAQSLMLQVNIEDGRNTGSQVDGIPTQRRNTISTQAIVKPLESIVLGGQIVESDSDSESGIPFLKDIPILGHAFKSSSVNRKSVERLFVISPRLINQATETATRKELPGFNGRTLTTNSKADAANKDPKGSGDSAAGSRATSPSR